MSNGYKHLLLAAALAVAALPPVTAAHEGAGHAPPDAACVTDKVRTGSGADTYESVPNWCQLPYPQPVMGATHGGVAVDKAGQIYFSLDAGPHGMLVYAPDGKFVRGFAEKFVGIHGLCLNDEAGEQFLYAAHLKGKQVVKFKLDGTPVWTIGFDALKDSGKYEKADQYKPTGVAVGPDGSVYVADGYGQNWVHQFDKDQKYVRSFGGKGKEPGQFQTCHGIALDKRGDKPLLLVCDRANKRLQHFDLDGKFVAVITEDLRLPCAVSFHGDKIAVAELGGRVAIVDGKNKVVSVLGDNPEVKQRANFNVPPADWKEAVFNAPHGISYDKDGNLYVMDWNASGRVSKLVVVGGGEKGEKPAEKKEQARGE